MPEATADDIALALIRHEAALLSACARSGVESNEEFAMPRSSDHRAALRRGFTLVDCLTLLVSNAMLQSEGDAELAERRVTEETEMLIAAARSGAASILVVSGEVGQGLVPETPLGRLFRDLLGRANQMLASEAEVTYWMVAGLAVDVRQLATSAEQAADELISQGLRKS